MMVSGEIKHWNKSIIFFCLAFYESDVTNTASALPFKPFLRNADIWDDLKLLRKDISQTVSPCEATVFQIFHFVYPKNML